MNKWGKKTGLLLWTVVASVGVTACTSGGGNGDGSKIGKLDRDDEGTLKVAYFNEQAFYMQYGNAFQAMFPNVELEVVSIESAYSAEDPAAEIKRIIDEEQPDVLYLTEDEYAEYAQDGRLYDLDAVIKQDEFDLASFAPAVIDLLKARGDGKLFGLSPNFSSLALYYNKDLFEKHGVPLPTDGMSWEDVLKLAARFPAEKGGDNPLYGITPQSQSANPFELIRQIGEAKGLLYADSEAETVSIDTPEWKMIFQSVIDGYKSGSVLMPGQNNGSMGGAMGGSAVVRSIGGRSTFSFGGDSMRFMSGEAAMAIDGPMAMGMLGMSGSVSLGAVSVTNVESDDDGPSIKQEGPGPMKEIDWDVVTLPTDPSQPDVSGGISLDSVFSINAASENVPAAWEFLKYVNGEQLAKTNSGMSPSLSARTAYKKEVDGKNIDAFYALGANSQILLQQLPSSFTDSFAELAAAQIKQVADGSAELDAALATLQSQGQELLTKALLDSAE